MGLEEVKNAVNPSGFTPYGTHLLGVSSATCKRTVRSFPRVKARALWSKYLEVGGYGLIYPKGDSQALPGYISIYLQIMDPSGTSSSKWDCFASYQL
jgi:hypothetical protein